MILRFGATVPVSGRPTLAIRRILVPLDGSALARAALVPAEELARRTGARLDLLTTKVAEGPPQPTSFLDDVADEISTRVAGVELRTTTTMEADPAQAIQSSIEDDGGALIVMSSHGRGRVRRAALGSTAELVVGSGLAPAVIVGPSFEPAAYDPDGPVLVAHDGHHEPDVETIAKLAATAGGRLIVLQVFPSPSLARDRSGLVVSDAAAACASRLREMGFEVMTEAERGANTQKEIIEAAKRLGPSYVAMSSRSRTGARRAVLGSVAASVVRSSRIPVVVSRATGED